jgi:hypothetical protein
VAAAAKPIPSGTSINNVGKTIPPGSIVAQSTTYVELHQREQRGRYSCYAPLVKRRDD